MPKSKEEPLITPEQAAVKAAAAGEKKPPVKEKAVVETGEVSVEEPEEREITPEKAAKAVEEAGEGLDKKRLTRLRNELTEVQEPPAEGESGRLEEAVEKGEKGGDIIGVEKAL